MYYTSFEGIVNSQVGFESVNGVYCQNGNIFCKIAQIFFFMQIILGLTKTYKNGIFIYGV